MRRDYFHVVVTYPRGICSCRFWPTADCVLSVAVGRISVTFVHACLIMHLPGNFGELIQYTVKNCRYINNFVVGEFFVFNFSK